MIHPDFPLFSFNLIYMTLLSPIIICSPLCSFMILYDHLLSLSLLEFIYYPLLFFILFVIHYFPLLYAVLLYFPI